MTDDIAAFLRARLDEDEAVAEHEPARVLREVEAMQAVVELHGRAHSCPAYDQYGDGPGYVEPAPWQVVTCCDTLRCLAAIWGSHPDYRAEWAPAPRLAL
jgi:hypothetical protein